MVDKAVGSAGTLRITDDGTTVRFYVLCSDPSTNVGSYQFAVDGVWGTTSLPSGFGSKLLATRTYSSSRNVTLQQANTGTSGLGGASTLAAFITRAAPNAPSSLSVSRVSDSQHTLNWTRNSTYTSVVVQRNTGSGSSWSGWQQIGIASGNAFTFTDRTTVGNKTYVYRVAGRASTGQSAWSGTTAIFTTPAAPTGASAVRSGSNIVVSVSTVPPYATSFDVEDAGVVVASSVSLPFTHVAPNPADPHVYRVRGKVGTLVGAWSAASNTVQLVAAPNPPTGLAPNGAVRASDADVLFSWVHNPVDSSPQSAYELRHREPAGVWTTLTGTTAVSRTVALPVGDFEWEVRTKGEHPDWSGWSSTAVFTVIDRPGVAVVQPDAVWSASTLQVGWSWLQAQGRPQSAWQVELVSAGLVVESRSGSGSASSVLLSHRLTAGEWTVRVRAATGDVWSVWASETFTVVFDPPAEPIISGVWDEVQGGVNLQVTGVVPGGAVLVGGVWYAEVEFE